MPVLMHKHVLQNFTVKVLHNPGAQTLSNLTNTTILKIIFGITMHHSMSF